MTNKKVYVFNITLNLENSPVMHSGKINQNILKKGEAPWREIAILENDNLYNFAKVIINSFGFMFDHCFGFYSNLEERKMYDSKEIYELFTDLKDEEHTPKAKGVKKEKISEAFKEKGKKMLFYFDYGDSWNFFVELKDIKETDIKKSYPILLSRHGKKPEQYPSFEE
ncbi:hypothetical protein CVV26_02700 [Candidatus Kuenenbacteria bacterium HGW-Kuenenbacteria-1]|uniref:Plasmid pRiA4b Orf3-like domain-containing protein n=1 Tax=Candidatus Kuenenbacteria bacterium HGW-Kuenenbacteria-1 TaxID=2013812 RepID=A0A2N1UN50_9BACT|nr:MAG: hypothetical protein CVV26_02700 [Candidatus Kuenenbacteria bacterium HGW-Kuenenbacteria-1]